MMTARNDIESFTMYYCCYCVLFITCYLLSFLRPCQCLLCFGTGSPTVPFAAFLHLIRGYLQSIKQKQMQREEAALRLHQRWLQGFWALHGCHDMFAYIEIYIYICIYIYVYTCKPLAWLCSCLSWMNVRNFQNPSEGFDSIWNQGTRWAIAKKPCFVWGM